ncbi:unnamed protein product [Peniophora sp. CBMAI 1063]|nr:unnamed protein product [Peniophora sp. CBMAI 1063]
MFLVCIPLLEATRTGTSGRRTAASSPQALDRCKDLSRSTKHSGIGVNGRLSNRTNDLHDALLTTFHASRSPHAYTAIHRDSDGRPVARSNRPRSPRPTSSYYNSLVPIAPAPNWSRQSGSPSNKPTLPPIPSLLAPPTNTQPGDAARRYQLEVVQQPEVTAEFGSNALSRLPLSPPLVARLSICDDRRSNIDDDPDLPFLIAQVALFSEDGQRELDAQPSPMATPPPSTFAEQQQRRMLLYGSTVSSPQYLRDLNGRPGVFFLFPDIGVQRQGRYTLRIRLLRLSRFDPTRLMSEGEGSSSLFLAQASTGPFTVVPRSHYIAPEQTRLTRHFLMQGVNMRL